jgi:hypothetical protein
MSLSLAVLDHLRKEVYTRAQKLEEDEFLSKYRKSFLAKVIHEIESSIVLRQGDLELDPYSSYIEWEDPKPRVTIRLSLQNKDWDYVVRMQKNWEEVFGKDLSIGYEEAVRFGNKVAYVSSLDVRVKDKKGKPLYLWLSHVPREKVKSVEENAKKVGFNVTETTKILPHTLHTLKKRDWEMLKELLEELL